MKKLLPIGAYVLVTEKGEGAPAPYYGIVRGYSLFHDKYDIGRRFAGWDSWWFTKGSCYVFTSWCAEVTEAEATAMPRAEEASA